MSRVTSSLDLLAKVKLSGVDQVDQMVVVSWGNNRESMQPISYHQIYNVIAQTKSSI